MPRDSQALPFAIIQNEALRDEAALVQALIAEAALPSEARAAISAQGADLVGRIRKSAKPGLMEVFLAEYGLSTDEGIALMCLAEALLRVPDAETMDALIEDKIAPSDWEAPTGGYLITACLATGRWAGRAAADYLSAAARL